MRRGPLLAVCCALLLVLAGCAGGANTSGADGGADVGATAAADEAGAPEDASDGSSGGDDAAGVNAQIQNRELIYEATLTLRVDDYDTARTSLTEMTNARGGYVGSATKEVRGEGNQSWTVGQLVLRIPTGNYSGAMAAINDTGEVRSLEESTDDVTNQIVDLEARLESLRAERDRLRELYEDANDTEDVLAVQRELADVQTEIERTEAQLTNLERRVAFSTITVRIEERRPDYEPPERTAWYDTPVTQAFLESVDGVVVLAKSAVVLTAYALPYLLVLAIPGVGVAIGVRRVRRRD